MNTLLRVADTIADALDGLVETLPAAPRPPSPREGATTNQSAAEAPQEDEAADR